MGREASRLRSGASRAKIGFEIEPVAAEMAVEAARGIEFAFYFHLLDRGGEIPLQRLFSSAIVVSRSILPAMESSSGLTERIRAGADGVLDRLSYCLPLDSLQREGRLFPIQFRAR